MNRNFWQKECFGKIDTLQYECSVCHGNVVPITAYDFHSSKCYKSFNPAPFDECNYITAVLLKCSNCGKEYLLLADVTENVWADVKIKELEEVISVPETQIVPKFIYPSVHIIRCERPVPKRIRQYLESSFSLYYVDIQMCAAYLRKTIEAVLTHQKLSQDSLIHKINHVENKWIKSLLIGIKDLGNTGIHANYYSKKITRADVLDGYEILEEILDEYYYHSKDNKVLKAQRLSQKFSNQKSKVK